MANPNARIDAGLAGFSDMADPSTGLRSKGGLQALCKLDAPGGKLA